MRPKFLTPRNFLLILTASVIAGGLVWWGSRGFPLPGGSVASTEDKLVYAAERDGKTGLYWVDSSSESAPETFLKADDQPDEITFAPNGQTVFYTAERGSRVRQIVRMAAAPNERIITLTKTSGTKEKPLLRGRDRLFFLDAGKVSAMNTDATDPTAIFPTAEGRRNNPLIGKLFEEGGITSFSVNPDGKFVAAVVNREQGQVLAVYLEGVSSKADGSAPETHGVGGAVVVLGAAKKIFCEFQPDGRLNVLYVGGAPFKEAMVLPDVSPEQAEAIRAQPLTLPGVDDAMAGVHVLTRYTPDMKVDGNPTILPLGPDGMALSPDASLLAVWSAKADQTAGIVVLRTDGAGEPRQLTQSPVSDVVWNPNGNRLAFVADGDIYTILTDGSSAPVNRTGGKGKSSSPRFSPVLPRSKP